MLCPAHLGEMVPVGKRKQLKCRDCNREYQSKWFKANKETQYKRVAANNKAYRERNMRYALVYKQNITCADCGESDPIVLDFDHRDPAQKSFTIGARLGRISLERLIEEIKKCDVRCANCHRRKTAKELNFYSYMEDENE